MEKGEPSGAFRGFRELSGAFGRFQELSGGFRRFYYPPNKERLSNVDQEVYEVYRLSMGQCGRQFFDTGRYSLSEISDKGRHSLSDRYMVNRK